MFVLSVVHTHAHAHTQLWLPCALSWDLSFHSRASFTNCCHGSTKSAYLTEWTQSGSEGTKYVLCYLRMFASVHWLRFKHKSVRKRDEYPGRCWKVRRSTLRGVIHRDQVTATMRQEVLCILNLEPQETDFTIFT